MDPRDIHFVQTMPLQAPDPSWLEEPEDELAQDTRFVRWDERPEEPWEEFSLEHVAPPELVAHGDTVYVATGPVDDTVEQAILASGLGAVVVAGMCLASAFLGFLIGLVVAA
jgi:hypothetical protein